MRSLLVLLMAGLLGGVALAQQTVRVGVLAFQDKQQTVAHWQPTADWLSGHVPGSRFEVLALDYPELTQAVAAGRVEFVFTNPEHYVVLRNQHQLRPMVTLNRRINGQVVDQFGSVIFTRADSPLQTLGDLRHKRLGAVSIESLGGFLMAADMFRQQGLLLTHGDPVQMVFLGLPQTHIVQAVQQGRLDAGIVRTGLLEQMQAQGQIDLSQIRVLNPQQRPGFPQLLSTDLYPEWPWTALQHVSGDLVKATTLGLLQIPSGSPAALAGAYQGFSTPASYISIEALMRRLNVYPGMRERPVWLVLWQDHQGGIALVLLGLMAAGLLLVVYFWRSNARLRELTQINQQAQSALEVAAAAFDSQVGLIVTDEFTRIRRANRAMLALLGYRDDELHGQMTTVLRGAAVADGSIRQIWQAVQARGRWQGELICRHRSGQDVPCMVTVTGLRGARGEPIGYVGSFTDITERKQAETSIRQLAYFDPLTQLPNRRMFLEALQQAMDEALRLGTLAAVMFIDLDFFKNLNDAHGHAVGDQLLLRIAQRLQLIIGPHDLAARLGGDEFVIMLPGLDTSEDTAMQQAMTMAQTIHQAILSPFELDTANLVSGVSQSLRYTCSGSIGVSLFGLTEESLTEVLKRADVAMYSAKQTGRNKIRPYDPAAQRAVNDAMSLSNDLNLALRDGQLHLLYQLQVDAHDHPVAAECLLRWVHPQRGAVSPAEFIPLAEESGAIIAMGDWVVRSACEALAAWAQQPALAQMTLSVNVSPRQFLELDFVQRIQRIVHDTGARAERLRLEVTEGIVMQDTPLVISRMQELCALGISFSIDDFGTGYSSLSYMQMLPLAEIKIDKTFISNLTTSERSAAIVKAVIALGHSMGITIVSEGVETQAQKVQLLALGSTLLQGYLIARPVSRAEIEQQVCTRAAPALTTDPHAG